MIGSDQIQAILTPPTTSVEKAARVLGVSRSFAYEAIARGEIESVRIGGKIFVLTAPLRRQFQIDQNT